MVGDKADYFWHTRHKPALLKAAGFFLGLMSLFIVVCQADTLTHRPDSRSAFLALAVHDPDMPYLCVALLLAVCLGYLTVMLFWGMSQVPTAIQRSPFAYSKILR